MATAVVFDTHSHRPSDATMRTWRSGAGAAVAPPSEHEEQQEATAALDTPVDVCVPLAPPADGSGSTVTSGLHVTPTLLATAEGCASQRRCVNASGTGTAQA